MPESKIWKFPFGEVVESTVPWEFHIKTPLDTQPLHVGYDGVGQLCMWGKFQTVNESQEETHIYYVVPTGEPFNLSADHVGTIMRDGLLEIMRLVFHIFRGPITREGEDA